MAFCSSCGSQMNGAFCGSCGAQSGGGAQSSRGGGMGCYHHSSKQAVSQCSDCGKGMCKDCYDSYGAGMGAGRALCFDCTEAIINEHARDLLTTGEVTEDIRKKTIIGLIVGAVIGAIVGVGIGAWPGAGIGGSIGQFGFVGFIKYLFAKDEYGEGGFGNLIFACLAGPFYSIYHVIKDRKVLAQCQELAASEQETLRMMRDYFQYTLAMEESAGVDLATLANQGGTLFGNTYANAVMSNGEKSAQTELRQGVAQIAANGEIIRGISREPRKRAS